MDQVEQIREKIDIISFISEYIQLKKAGHNFKAVCPFHSEKTPSLVVSPERQIWHCFGCAKGGDVYSFLMEYEHLEFPEALRMLAKRAGIELIRSFAETAMASQKEKIYRMNKIIMEFYHYILTQHNAGRMANEYLRLRNVDPRVVKTFKLGFAPSVGNTLSKYLVEKKKFTRQDILESGASILKGRDLIDFFRGRIIFPLIDHRDNVLGFSGRVLEDRSGQIGSKYINTKDTLAYHKRDHFFGINVSLEAIKKHNQAILVEGEFDVISCFQNGIANVVAIKGTALTENQVRLLSRFTQKITICFDGDQAGKEAIKRSIPVLESKNLITTVIVLPQGKDPDEILRMEPSVLKQEIKHEVGVYDYMLTEALRSVNRQSMEGKKKIANELIPIYAHIENEIIKEHYMRKLSQELDTSYASVIKEIEKINKKDVLSMPTVSFNKRERIEILEEYLLSLILQNQFPNLVLEKALSILNQHVSKERAYKKIMESLRKYVDEHEKFDQKQFAQVLPKELLSLYDTCLLYPLPNFKDRKSIEKEIIKTATEMRSIYIRDQIARLSREIKEKEKLGLLEEVDSLQLELSELFYFLKSLSLDNTL